MYWVKTPKWIKTLFPSHIWEIKSNQEVFITFDDGPIPEITPWVLDILQDYNANATFFCVGDNVVKHKYIYQRILDEGHAVGNHTMNHLSAWKNNRHNYMDNVNMASDHIQSNLFRPPYGKLTKGIIKDLKNQGFKIIMWDILSGDFDAKLSPANCYINCIDNIKAGSIIVFHDNIKSIEKVKYTLPKLLDFLDKKKLKCKAIELPIA